MQSSKSEASISQMKCSPFNLVAHAAVALLKGLGFRLEVEQLSDLQLLLPSESLEMEANWIHCVMMYKDDQGQMKFAVDVPDGVQLQSQSLNLEEAKFRLLANATGSEELRANGRQLLQVILNEMQQAKDDVRVRWVCRVTSERSLCTYWRFTGTDITETELDTPDDAAHAKLKKRFANLFQTEGVTIWNKKTFNRSSKRSLKLQQTWEAKLSDSKWRCQQCTKAFDYHDIVNVALHLEWHARGDSLDHFTADSNERRVPTAQGNLTFSANDAEKHLTRQQTRSTTGGMLHQGSDSLCTSPPSTLWQCSRSTSQDPQRGTSNHNLPTASSPLPSMSAADNWRSAKTKTEPNLSECLPPSPSTAQPTDVVRTLEGLKSGEYCSFRFRGGFLIIARTLDDDVKRLGLSSVPEAEATRRVLKPTWHACEDGKEWECDECGYKAELYQCACHVAVRHCNFFTTATSPPSVV